MKLAFDLRWLLWPWFHMNSFASTASRYPAYSIDPGWLCFIKPKHTEISPYNANWSPPKVKYHRTWHMGFDDLLKWSVSLIIFKETYEPCVHRNKYKLFICSEMSWNFIKIDKFSQENGWISYKKTILFFNQLAITLYFFYRDHVISENSFHDNKRNLL